VCGREGLIEAKPHTMFKYEILGKYLKACEVFFKKYENFAYVDTHGGTGRVYSVKESREIDGSVLIAATHFPKYPIYAVEIDPNKYSILRRYAEDYPNVKVYFGDCNELIDTIISQLPLEKCFCFFFMDPDGLTVRVGSETIDQLRWETVEKVAELPRTEVLINLQVFAVMRSLTSAKSLREKGDHNTAESLESTVSRLYGSENWRNVEDFGDYRALARVYINQLKQYYNYIGAILIREVNRRGPLYYLIYGTKNKTGAKIMRDIMKKVHEKQEHFKIPEDKVPSIQEFIFDFTSKELKTTRLDVWF